MLGKYKKALETLKKPYNGFMKTYSFEVLPTATQITQELKPNLMEYLKDYQTEHPEQTEETRILIGVLDLYNEQTKDYLRYTGAEILNIVRQLYYYGTPVKRALDHAKLTTPGALILRTSRGHNNAVMITRLRYRDTAERLEEVKTQLLGVHGIDPERVRLENRKGNEEHKLDLLERKADLEAMLSEYKQTITRAEQIRKDINTWFRSKAPEEIRKKIDRLEIYDTAEAAQILGPYEDEIINYSKMDIWEP